ncbi:phosphorylated CTD-interacting factor 1 [Toxoplasma gondii TgCatPRC2]|uniref:Phosphorylated CTD-interacting factor 1 n=2 Tax=Toxoplasma gondii TaxID=5811 RepID=A0A151HIT1_TOXGO|nr:hypothetical protein TGME49_227080 [Toxoplasma gondii ME49]EPT27207.1 hypothetical protein TGME49_227080 [Toxoplasma gondii ME49]KYK69262.1 phosphorylated CTD-interacting factor 1 [Toxoplasma gondii TgCatPRC2]|eukprot:XP_002366361.1 hypothetical protein TGME49_227080 [Toxoplasma gondii ME49]
MSFLKNMPAADSVAVRGGPRPEATSQTDTVPADHGDISSSYSDAFVFTEAKGPIPTKVLDSSNDCLTCEARFGASMRLWVCSKPYTSWPLIELVRQYEILGVRLQYEQLCQSLVKNIRQSMPGMDICGCGDRSRWFAPRESFNRWLMERRSIVACHADPLIPSPIQPSLSSREGDIDEESECVSITREILDDLPMKIHIGDTSLETRENVLRFTQMLASEMRVNQQMVAELPPSDVQPIMQWIRELEDGEGARPLIASHTGHNERRRLENSVSNALPQANMVNNGATEAPTEKQDEDTLVEISQSSIKEVVYNTIRLARPVVECLYAEKVSRVVRQLQEISRDAASRVQEFCKSCNSSKNAGVAETLDVSATRETVARHFKRRCVRPRGGEVQFGCIRWMSGRNNEFFEFTGDLSARFKDGSPFSPSGQQSLTRKYAIKGYKLAQLWRRFVMKSGQKDMCDGTDVEVLCKKALDPGCVCEGRGWRGGDWTCECVRDLIDRIRSVKSIGSLFASAVFALLCRYHSICGCQNQGKGLQYAVPPNVLDVLRDDLKVNCELFASPFNVHFDNYCSIFPDVDVMFGSRGSFFDPSFQLLEGSFEANPPFDEVLMARMVQRLLSWLKKSEERQRESLPLSFCLSLPDWSNGPSEFMYLLKKSEYLRYSEVIPEGKHVYLNGFQHFCHTCDLEVPAVCGTFFAVLQNEAGTKAWPVTDTFINRLKEAWS